MMAAAAVSQQHHHQQQTFLPRVLYGAAKQEPPPAYPTDPFRARQELANPSSYYTLKEELGATAGLYGGFKGAPTGGGLFGAGLYDEQECTDTIL